MYEFDEIGLKFKNRQLSRNCHNKILDNNCYNDDYSIIINDDNIRDVITQK